MADDSDPGLASRRDRGLNCHQTGYSRTSVDCINTKRGGFPKTPLCEGKGPENPGVVAPFVVAGCHGNRGNDVFGRSHMPAFSSPLRATMSSTSTPQMFASLQRTDDESSVNGGMLWN